MNYKIEKLEREDLTSYKELIDECFGQSNDISLYEQYEQNHEYTVWVVKDENEIVGSVTQYAIRLFTFGFQPCLMLFNVAVRKAYRKNGIAKLLFEHIIATAQADGYKSISLTCLETAYSAHKLYESMGFKRMGSIKFELDLSQN